MGQIISRIINTEKKDIKLDRKYFQEIKIDLITNPLDEKSLETAIEWYNYFEKNEHIIEYRKLANKLDSEIEKVKKFKHLFFQGREQVKQSNYPGAINYFNQAKIFYSPSRLVREIEQCKLQIQKQEAHISALSLAHHCAQQGMFKEALMTVQEALISFSSPEGEKLLVKLQTIIEGKERFTEGLMAEKEGKLSEAIIYYRKAIDLIPELEEARIKLGLLEIGHRNWQGAINALEGINGEQFSYLRGFAYYQQNQWQKADRAWRNINDSDVQEQRNKLKILAKTDKILTLNIIQKLVDQDELEKAQLLSQEFLEKFGVDPIVEQNLEKHIRPRLETEVFALQDWEKIAQVTERNWRETQTIESLHNWAISTYYQAQNNPETLSSLIISWSTVLVNLDADPSLQDIPWLGSQPVDFQEVSEQLKKMVDNLLEEVKEQEVEKYSEIQDLYRQEIVAIRLIGNPPSCGVRVKGLFITPGCYNFYKKYLPNLTFPDKTWGTLYSDWGKCVAACLEGNMTRAIQIKPNSIESSVDEFAEVLVSYYEGCYHLQQYQWKEAIIPLKKAQQKIKLQSDWNKKVDYLCQLQFQPDKFSNLDDSLMFAEFWYQLLDSMSARNYLVQFKAQNIAQQFDQKKINNKKALYELNKLKEINKNNAILLDIIYRIEVIQEINEINKLFISNNFEKAIFCAQKSRHYTVRYQVAQYLINFLIDGSQRRTLNRKQITEIGNSAYNLCPNEPAFQEVYRSLYIT
ncbi:MAG: tetratricopeptide repeat protein [Crocosphaera sp.]